MGTMTCEEHAEAVQMLDLTGAQQDHVCNNDCVEVSVASHYCDHILEVVLGSANNPEDLKRLLELRTTVQYAVLGVFCAGYRLAERDQLEKCLGKSSGGEESD